MDTVPCIFYCSGRSTLLYSLGRGLYSNIGLGSRNGSSTALIFPPFTVEGTLSPNFFTFIHYIEIYQLLLQSSIEFDSRATRKALARYIFQRSKGITRDTTYCISYLEYPYVFFAPSSLIIEINQRGTVKLKLKDITCGLLGERFIAKVSKYHSDVLDPFMNVDSSNLLHCILSNSHYYYF